MLCIVPQYEKYSQRNGTLCRMLFGSDSLPLHAGPGFHQLANVEGDLIKKSYIYNVVQLDPNLAQNNTNKFDILRFNHPKPLDHCP